MADVYKGLVDARGRPIEKRALLEETAAASISGVRSPITGYPGDGLNPQRVAAILREADTGNPIRFLELAETVEERDPHIVGVLGTRKRSVSQLEITVEDASSDPAHKMHAELVREWLKRDELASELFDLLDAIHKGYSFTEIIWDTSEGQWVPGRLEWRDPRWFDFALEDLRTPQMMTEGGQRLPLPGGKFIYAPMAAKSGIPTRSGLARVLSWVWMFKAFSNRDWAIFSQTYGQPIRVGRYGQGASATDKSALFRAVANVAGDMAAIIPESMKIEFVETGNVSASSDLYEKRVVHLNLEASKAVLGQTTTTDAVSGGHAVSQEHRLVQEDIERSDCRQLAAHLNRDLVKVWIDLEFGPQAAYPRLRIGRPEQKDVDSIVRNVRAMKLPVKKADMYGLLGVAQPEAGDEVITWESAQPDPHDDTSSPDSPDPNDQDGRRRAPGPPTLPPGNARQQPRPDRPLSETLHSELPPYEADARRALERIDAIVKDADAAGADALEWMLGFVGEIMADPELRDLEDLRSRLIALAPDISSRSLSMALRQAMTLAQLSGRSDLIDGFGS
ncbi:Mu-like prophage protein gp29 [Devosia enhydra]|uniref:Mu-like prophage protein gp29 n=1 Tax=Devosia enhydra TaxID=665118 RepID=A0A1K2I0Z6_9HYPH|nr:DUF935 family protein [Devosia enhydra]SFZ85992.1 Mu-like prophage protein gp29 [Devosia enhydra]